MNHQSIIEELSRNKGVFNALLSGLTEDQYTWKPQPEKWCLLEVICHLYDEEREDFRARVSSVLDNPEEQLPSINPVGWVTERDYMGQDFNEMLHKFIAERDKSVAWLQSLRDPKWDNAYQHPKFGAMTAKMFLANWLAHDYLHFRQITRLKYQYLQHVSGETLQYAGEW